MHLPVPEEQWYEVYKGIPVVAETKLTVAGTAQVFLTSQKEISFLNGLLKHLIPF